MGVMVLAQSKDSLLDHHWIRVTPAPVEILQNARRSPIPPREPSPNDAPPPPPARGGNARGPKPDLSTTTPLYPEELSSAPVAPWTFGAGANGCARGQGGFSTGRGWEVQISANPRLTNPPTVRGKIFHCMGHCTGWTDFRKNCTMPLGLRASNSPARVPELPGHIPWVATDLPVPGTTFCHPCAFPSPLQPSITPRSPLNPYNFPSQ